MKRIKTNIVDLNKLYKTPCEEWLAMFEYGKIDAHKVFKEYGQQYEWLYENSPYDLIGWEIDNGVFDWQKHSWAVAVCCPEYFDPERYNWRDHSWVVAMYCPEKLDPNKFNWGGDSYYVAEFCHQHLDPDRYNWKEDSWAVAQFCPDKLDPDKFNWERDEWAVELYCPELLKLKPKNINS